MTSQAVIPVILERYENRFVAAMVSLLAGVVLISILAQVAFPLPWTPVPVTGQTFGVALVSLMWGRRLAFSVLALYIVLGSLGLPIFALGNSGWVVGPTMGYLLGMWTSTIFVGYLADRGWTFGFWKSLAAAYIGSFITFASGLLILSYFVSGPELLMAGLIPFLPVDLLKNVAAAWVASRTRQKIVDDFTSEYL